MFSTRFLLSALCALTTTLSSVSAHGWIDKLSIDGAVYNGPAPATSRAAGKSVVRQLSDVGPVKGASNPDLACGLGAHAPAALVASAKPGSTVELQWRGLNGPWIHEIGPILTYMAQCTGTTCDKYDPANAKWFKINEIGQKADGTWYQADIKAGKSLTITLPADLAAGEYLLRPELIALHNAATVGGAEMYPSCVQLRVSGDDNAKAASPSDEVSFPGGYKDDSPSLVVPDIYNPGFKYTMPGPKLSNLVSSVMKITAALTGKDTGSAAAAAAGPGSADTGAANAGASPSDAVSTSSAVASTSSAATTVKTSTKAATTVKATSTTIKATSTAVLVSSSSSSAAAAAATSTTKTCSSRRSRRRANKERMFGQDRKTDDHRATTHEERMFGQDRKTDVHHAINAHRRHQRGHSA